MSERNIEEKGYKWWIRYVVVPLIGGGGIIALIVASLSQPQSSAVPTPTRKTDIQRIDFNYADSPLKHGWLFISGFDPSQVTFSPIYEDQSVRGTEVNSLAEWGMDFIAEPAAKQFGNVLEFVIIPRQDAAIFAYMDMEKSDGTSGTGWLKFMSCNEEVKPIIKNGTENQEWRVCLAPVSHEENWLVFRANLRDEVKKTFSHDGWSFRGLKKIRVRGNLALDYISIQEE